MFHALAATAPLAILTGTPARDRTPVRRHSFLKGREGMFWRPITRKEARRIVEAADRYEVANKGKGSHGPLGLIALKVLEVLSRTVDFRTGRLEPSIDWLMRTTGRSRAAIVRALKNLRTHGFLDWLRRYVPTDTEGRGPQVQQTSNAYRLCLPPRAAKLLGLRGQDAPPPDDFSHAQETRAADIAAHRETLGLVERTLFDMGDNPLGQTLARLAKAMQERESAKQTESRARFIS